MLEIKYNQDGLVPAIIQDHNSGCVLMMAYMNAESLAKTIAEGKTCFYSRSRNKLWTKGEESGHFQYVKEISVDCDCDCLLIKVEQVEAACHTNNYSCFYRDLDGDQLPTSAYADVLKSVTATIADRVANPKEGSYTNYLFDKGIDKMLKKVGEECAEVIIGAKNNSKEEVTYETADLFYHLLVMLHKMGLSPEDIYRELDKRHNK